MGHSTLGWGGGNIKNKWENIEYLQWGNKTQTEIYHILSKNMVLQIIQNHNPILVGTIPIGINIETSDLDIICEVKDFDEFERLCNEHFRDHHGFLITRREVEGIERIKINFMIENWPIEIFGQNKPTTEQNGYLHMIIEDRMLTMYGKKFNEQIIQLKSKGLKTEPAFAKILKLEGDPYLKLIELYNWTDEELRDLWVDSNDVA
ncbi:DUF4269 domain-containing protein [Cohnella mopanensis]|uniref:DUF4269 domain-containing protein n=1 Tax=Cohnella mopanensis TaxID=2911966 RepID=UPI001EF9B207|nr:DUF4269 domain-containing protein [Cohnella mopanensis]